MPCPLRLGSHRRCRGCYLAEDHGRNLGRVALWRLPTLTRPESVISLDSDDDAIAGELPAHAITVARQAGAETLGSVLDEPAQSPRCQADPERRAGWLVAAGFPVRRATSRWEMAADARSPAIPGRLLFRTLSDVGDAAFLDAIERVSAGSLDLYTRSERGRLGASGEARQTWDDLRDMEWQPGWWELAFGARTSSASSYEGAGILDFGGVSRHWWAADIAFALADARRSIARSLTTARNRRPRKSCVSAPAGSLAGDAWHGRRGR